MILDGRDVRLLCRRGELRGPTAGLAPGHVQANLVVLPRAFADDFARFCALNPRPCPLLETCDGPEPRRLASGADLRTDLPRYRVWRRGELVGEPAEVGDLWRDDFVAFLLGCSFTFERALLAAGLPVRHLEQGSNVPMYRTDRPCTAAGPFAGPLVVSMRPLRPDQAALAAEISARYPRMHGPPVHQGDPAELGIADLGRPDHGDPVALHDDEIPVFWACGVTSQVALAAARPEIALTHAPGSMFVTDALDTDFLDATE